MFFFCLLLMDKVITAILITCSVFLSAPLYLCLSIYLYLYLSVSVCLSLSMYIFLSLNVCLSISVPICHLSRSVCFCLFISLYLYLSVSLRISLSLCQYICLSISTMTSIVSYTMWCFRAKSLKFLLNDFVTITTALRFTALNFNPCLHDHNRIKRFIVVSLCCDGSAAIKWRRYINWQFLWRDLNVGVVDGEALPLCC